MVPGTLVGLDIGGSSIKGVRIRDAEVVAESVSDSYERPDAPTLKAALTQTIRSLQIPADGAARVGLCTPGILNESRTRIVQAVNLPGLVGLDLEAELRAALDTPIACRLVTDALASAYAYWARERRAGRLLALVIGTGVGACVLDDGRPLEVVDACPGHIGQIDVGPIGHDDPPIGPDGGRGSLEAYLGAAALTARFGPDRITGLLAADPHDPALVALARAIRIGHAIYRPDEIILLGGVGTRLHPQLPTIDALVRDALTSVARDTWRLRCGDSDRYGAEGAALLAGETSP